MKIGFDISAQCLPRSGVGRYQYHLIKALLEMDKENFYHLYAFNFRNRKRFNEIKYDAENYSKKVFPIPHRLITAWWMMAGWPTLEQVVGECDVYHISELCVQPTKKAKTVAFVHDLTTILFPELHVKSNIYLHKKRFENLHKVDAVLTNSENTKRDIVEHIGIDPHKIHVTYLGADECFRPMDESSVSLTLDKYRLKKPYILFVGTLEPRKNIKTLIQAFNRLKKVNNIPHQLVLVGQKGWLYEDVFEEIELSEFKDDIVCTDYAKDHELPALMNGADLFVYPSIYEGFGLPVLEAMQCGTPVITSNISSLPEVGGDACLYFEPHSMSDLADQMIKVINDPNLQVSLSIQGLEQAKKFSWGKCAEKTLKVYKSL